LDFPSEFNWVRECSKCSLSGAMFNLRETVDNDIKAFSGLSTNRQFEILDKGPQKFIVRHKDGTHDFPQAIVFETDSINNRISIRAGTAIVLAVKPEIGPDGECLLKVDGKYLRFWQVSKEALESLFFGP